MPQGGTNTRQVRNFKRSQQVDFQTGHWSGRGMGVGGVATLEG